jgi:hypothetical protein
MATVERVHPTAVERVRQAVERLVDDVEGAAEHRCRR